MKKNPKEKFIKQNNAARIKWNTAVSRAISMSVPVKLLIAVKEIEITEPIRAMLTVVSDKGTAMDALTGIISRAVRTLGSFVDKVIRYHLKEKMKPEDKLFYMVLGESRGSMKKKLDRYGR